MKHTKFATMCAVVALATSLPAAPAHAQIEPFIGQLTTVGFNFCPRGWAHTDGQIMSISQNTALFSLLGTTYGGNGQTTFALPDLRGRVPIHRGQGPGLSNYTLGQVSGTESTTLTVGNMPSHNHPATVNVNNTVLGNSGNPNGNHFALSTNKIYHNSAGAAPNAFMGTNAVSTGPTGGSQPFSNLQPYLVLNTCIAMEGIFPSRN